MRGAMVSWGGMGEVELAECEQSARRTQEPGTGIKIDFSKFEDITYESFRRRATDPSLSLHEKVGFPDGYREGKETLDP